MKVFINKLSTSGNYCGGLIVVAANSALEAHGLMCLKNHSRNYLPDKWQELENVSADVREPQILAEDSLSPCE